MTDINFRLESIPTQPEVSDSQAIQLDASVSLPGQSDITSNSADQSVTKSSGQSRTHNSSAGVQAVFHTVPLDEVRDYGRSRVCEPQMWSENATVAVFNQPNFQPEHLICL